MTIEEFHGRYLWGRCDALAVALATYHDCPIRAFRPLHVRADGTTRVDPDFVHVYAVVDGIPTDARGSRSEADILAEYAPFMDGLRRDGEIRVEAGFVDYESADEFAWSAGCNLDGAADALRAAVDHLGLDAQRADAAVDRLPASNDDDTGEEEEDGAGDSAGLFFV